MLSERQLIRAMLVSFACALATLALLVSLNGCAPSRERPYWSQPQDPPVASLTGRYGNVVTFGASVATDRYPAVVAAIDSETQGRLPGVRFEVVRYPVMIGTKPVISFRAPTIGLIALSWRDGPFRVEDIHWEVSHLIDGTDDNGRKWP